jgi:hypothetical protein
LRASVTFVVGANMHVDASKCDRCGRLRHVTSGCVLIPFLIGRPGHADDTAADAYLDAATRAVAWLRSKWRGSSLGPGTT